MSTTAHHDVRDLGLSADGVQPHRVGRPADAGAGARSASASPPSGRWTGIRISACLHVTSRDREPDAHAQGRRRRRRCCAPPTRSRRRTTWRRRLVAEYGISVFAINGEDTRHLLPPHRGGASTTGPQITMDDGADVIGVLHASRPELLGEIIGGTEETTTGVIRLRAHGARRRARLPDRGGQRGRHQAPVRQPLRHRPVDDRRHAARHQRAAGRPHVRGLRLRLVRPRAGRPGARAWAPT